MSFEIKPFGNGKGFGYRVVRADNGAWTESYVFAEIIDNRYVLSWNNGLSHGNFRDLGLNERNVADTSLWRKAEELLEEKIKEEAVLSGSHSKT
ncbi:MAG: hypothetical protein ABSG05_00670 [Candidatus Pacearchaeota archaeon]|jgi:hypothetical protein